MSKLDPTSAPRAIQHWQRPPPGYTLDGLVGRSALIAPLTDLPPETDESSFTFNAKRPFHPTRLESALGVWPRPGALARVQRLNGVTWHGDVPNQQVQAVVAGEDFTILPGPPWWAADPRQQWPAGLAEQFVEELCHARRDTFNGTWDALYGDRRTELMCIGCCELDCEAAHAQLEACLLTPEEMVSSGLVRVMDEQSLEAMEAQKQRAMGNEHGHGGCGAHGGGGRPAPEPRRDRAADTDRSRSHSPAHGNIIDARDGGGAPPPEPPASGGGHRPSKEAPGLLKAATTTGSSPEPPNSHSAGLSATRSALFITSDLDGWRHASRHAAHNGLLMKRPFHGRWDACQPAIDACLARFDLDQHPSMVTRVPCHGRGDALLAAALEAAVGELLAHAALPAALSQQMLSDACAMGGAVAAMCASRRALEVRLEVAGENACRRWHQDQFVGRALTSYTGVVSTEYTGDENVNFWELQNCGDNDHILRDNANVETIDVGDVLFIKGSMYEGSKPLVHRSPAKRYHADGRIVNRLLLKVDVLP